MGLAISKRFKIITKINNLKKFKKLHIEKKIINLVKDSIMKLRVKKLYCLLIHDINDLKGDKSDLIYNIFLKIKKKGLAKHIGFSCYSIKDLKYVLSKFKFDIVQFPFNVFDQRLLKNNIIRYLKSKKIEVHIRSIFLQGLLLMNRNLRPKKFNKWRNQLEKWDNFLAKNNLTSIEACLFFVLKYNFYKKIIVGVDNQKQINEILDIYKNYKKTYKFKFNKLIINDQKLINPSKW